MEKELIPYIEKTYPATNYRTFIGHSFGGLAVIDALVERPNLFNNYVAIDPSLWWDNQEFLKNAESAISTSNYEGKSLFVGVANTLAENMKLGEVEKDTTEATIHIRSILKFVKTADALDNGLNFKWKYYEDDSHGSVPLIAEYDALRFLFPWYDLKGIDQFFNPNSETTVVDLQNLIVTHYKEISRRFGYKVLPPESFINMLGYGFLSQPKMQNKAHAMFELNIKNYPTSSNVYDSMGDCYLAQQDSTRALEYYTKALEVGNNDFSQAKIDKLKQAQKAEK